MQDLSEILSFLPCSTPDRWVENALENQEVMLIDHAHCEKKAAATALSLMHRYVEHLDVQHKMSRLAREELRHYEQVLAIIKKRGMKFGALSASRYASGMRDKVRGNEPGKLVDTLIVGAFIEARSCERFAKLAPFLAPDLQKFYLSLLKSEARHYQDYLHLAQRYSETDIEPRVAMFAEIEKGLIESSDETFRFHSGPVS
ncbi:MAG: tRNA-(ms[2]io[6]A)-hydroxylase [Hahellaceae bacterium]|nr:tRNA-(ms[2]io[6]A)-hydroxylase [Hahellaceae bacterium]